MYIHRLVKALLYTFLSILFVCTAEAGNAPAVTGNQETQLVRGTVADQTGNMVPDFPVDIRAHHTGATALKAGSAPLTLHTDPNGQFSATLTPGSYEVCVPRYPKSCVTITVQQGSVSPDPLTLKIIPSEEILDPDLPDSRFRAIAGVNAENCGHIRVKESRKRATACAHSALKHHKPFYVIYDEAGIDSIIASGMAGDSEGKLYSVTFDSMGMSNDHLPPGTTMPDGFHTLVIPCSRPVRVRVTRTGQLTCFADGRWMKKDD